MPLSRRWRDFLLFGGIGIVTFGIVFWLDVVWLQVAASLMGRDRIIFDQQPSWIRTLNSAVSAVPWAIGFALLVVGALRRRWMPLLAFAGAQILGLAAILAVLFGEPVVSDYWSRVPFDAAAWKSLNRRDAEGLRAHMVDDLLRRHTLVGMTRAQVDELLGVPPPTDYFREYDYVYWLGPERGPFGIDSEWLVLKYNGDLVVGARVVTD